MLINRDSQASTFRSSSPTCSIEISLELCKIEFSRITRRPTLIGLDNRSDEERSREANSRNDEELAG